MPMPMSIMAVSMVAVMVSVIMTATAVRLRLVFGDAGRGGFAVVMRGQTKRYEKLARRQVRREAQEKYQQAQYGF